MDIKPIRSNADYRAVLADVEGLMHADANTAEGDRLDVLVTLVEAYERKNYPMDLPDAIAAIEYSMERGGLTVHDLAKAIGRPNRVYEVLHGKRPLTLRMITSLHQTYGIPAESLLKQRQQPDA